VTDVGWICAADVRSQRLDPRPIWWRARILPAPAPQYRIAIVPGTRGQLIGEPALPDPRLSSQQEKPATTGGRVIKPLKQFPELSLASNKDGSRSLLDHCWTTRPSHIAPKDRPAAHIRSTARGCSFHPFAPAFRPFSRLTSKSTYPMSAAQRRSRDMSQVQRSIVAQPIPLKQKRYVAAAGIAAGIAAAVVAGVFIFSSTAPAPAAVRMPQIEQLEQLVDGWMPGMAAAQAARLARMQDGYLPGLLAARGSGDAVDGYLPGLLAARGSGDAVDGWESALIDGGRSSDARDGWESGLLH
jgi:hypothetical protein